jgi:3-deoxy-D-manno-octulosonate 8-phosphate phosphatase (KDO 8-P phosphatase)
LPAAIDESPAPPYRFCAMPKSRAAVLRRARKIKLLLMDVDGVLADGSIYYWVDGQGKVWEMKAFNSLDGAGLRLVQRAGLRTGIITGRESAAVAHRARELDVNYLEQDAFEKLPAYERVRRASRLADAEICFMGDDITDLPLFARVGLAVATANAHSEARRRAHYVTRARGGHGAVREVIDLLLRAQGRYDQFLRPFTA